MWLLSLSWSDLDQLKTVFSRVILLAIKVEKEVNFNEVLTIKRYCHKLCLESRARAVTLTVHH